MAVEGISSTSGGVVVLSKARDLGSLEDQFMKILLAEMRHQDPMDPMNEKDFFAQMAQFATASGMESLNNNLSMAIEMLVQGRLDQQFLNASALIGKEFRAKVHGVEHTGVIEAVCLQDRQVAIRSGSQIIPVTALIFVGGVSHACTDSD